MLFQSSEYSHIYNDLLTSDIHMFCKKKKKQTPVRYTDYKILSHDSSVDTDVQGSLTIASSSACSMGD